MKDEIILSTLENITGSDIEQHIGLVSGIGANSTSAATSIVSTLKNFFGGENVALTKLVQAARDQALDHLKEEARKMGANAVINMRFESANITSGTVEVAVYGTAVKVIKY